eukprot:403361153
MVFCAFQALIEVMSEKCYQQASFPQWYLGSGDAEIQVVYQDKVSYDIIFGGIMDNVPFIGYYLNKENYYKILTLLSSRQDYLYGFYVLNLIEVTDGTTIRSLQIDAEQEGQLIREVLSISYYLKQFVMIYSKGLSNYLLFISEDLTYMSYVVSIATQNYVELHLRCLSNPLEDSFVFFGGYYYGNYARGMFYGKYYFLSGYNEEQRFFSYTPDPSNGADYLGIYSIDYADNYMLACVSNENTQSASYPVMGYLVRNYNNNYEGTASHIGNSGSRFICIGTHSAHGQSFLYLEN